MKQTFTLCSIFCSFIIIIVAAQNLNAQTNVNSDTIQIAARDIIGQTTYCGLVTIDSTGQTQVRTMNPFPVNDDLVVWLATSRSSRKVGELKNNPKVAVYFANHNSAIGYVNISGRAEVIDDKELLKKMKRDYWEGISNWQDIFVLIKIVPERLEVINYKHGLNNDPKTFKAPFIDL